MKILCPGKAMLAGEYVVLGHTGVATALAVAPPRMVLDARPADAWRVTRPKDDAFALAALDLCATESAPAQEISLCLDPGEAGKIGAGMSAAACASVVAAVLARSGRDLRDAATRARLLALAVRAHREAQGGRGSGYDVATVVHGGLVVTRTEEDGAVSVYRRQPPKELAFARLPSGVHAATPGLIDRVGGVDPAPLRAAAERVAEAVDAPAMLAALDNAQRAFERWNVANELGLMPPELANLVATIRDAGFVARVSGAGGGDSVLAVSDDPEALAAQVVRWRADGVDAEVLLVDEQGLRLG